MRGGGRGSYFYGAKKCSAADTGPRCNKTVRQLAHLTSADPVKSATLWKAARLQTLV